MRLTPILCILVPVALSVLMLTSPTTLRADTVTLKNGSVLHGEVIEKDGETWLLLGSRGRMKLIADDIENLERNDRGKESDEAAEGGRRIATSHVARLKNGQEVRGDLVEGDEPGQITLSLGELGRFGIPEAQVESVTESGGEIWIPAPRPKPPVVEPAPAAPPTFEEIVAAIAADVVARHYSRGWGGPVALGREEAILASVRELTRQRSRVRVRAENELRRFGPAAIPFLRDVAGHPNELTRRAVQRLIRDAGIWEGMPLAITGLDDEDRFVRAIAREGIDGILQREYAGDPERPLPRRGLSSADYWQLWLEEEARRLEAELIAALEAALGPLDEEPEEPAETPEEPADSTR